MVWRMGSSPYTLGRFIMRHRLYIFGTFAWVVTGSLVLTSIKWVPHAQGAPEHPVRITISKQQPQPTPHVAGAETTVPASIVPTTPPPTHPVANVSAVVNLVASHASEGNPNPTPTSPIVSILPDMPATPVTPPVTTPDPTPPTTTPVPDPTPPPTPPIIPPAPVPEPTPPPTTPVCTVNPLLGFGLLGNSSLTVTAGTVSVVETLATNDSSAVVWQPGTAVIWGDNSASDATAPVQLLVGYTPSTIVGANITYAVKALATAAPGVYTVSWKVTDDTRAICYNMNIQVTVLGTI